jgi:hypothetical protein
MKPEIYLVLVEFGQQHEQGALALLMPTLHRLCPGAVVRTAVVDKLEGDIEAEIDPPTGFDVVGP